MHTKDILISILVAPLSSTMLLCTSPLATSGSSSETICASLIVSDDVFGGAYDFLGIYSSSKPNYKSVSSDWMFTFVDLTTRRSLTSFIEGYATFSSDYEVAKERTLLGQNNVPDAVESTIGVQAECETGAWTVVLEGDTDQFPLYFVFDCADDPSLITSTAWISCSDSECSTFTSYTAPSIECSTIDDESMFEDDEGNSGSSSGTQVALIAGIAGGVVALGAIGLLAFCFVKRKKKKDSPSETTTSQAGEVTVIPRLPGYQNSSSMGSASRIRDDVSSKRSGVSLVTHSRQDKVELSQPPQYSPSMASASRIRHTSSQPSGVTLVAHTTKKSKGELPPPQYSPSMGSASWIGDVVSSQQHSGVGLGVYSESKEELPQPPHYRPSIASDSHPGQATSQSSEGTVTSHSSNMAMVSTPRHHQHNVDIPPSSGDPPSYSDLNFSNL